VVVATSVSPTDDAIRRIGRKFGIAVFTGSLNDVLDRFYQAACVYGAEVVLRVTGDCPLFDPELVRQMLERFLADGQLDHIGMACGAGLAGVSGGGGRFPDGLDAELTTIAALEAAWREAQQPIEREHVTPFIWRRPERFRVATHFSPVDYSQLRWTVDNLEDLEVVRAVYEALYRPDRHFLMHDVLRFLTDHPEIRGRNQQFVGHEGYDKFWESTTEPCPPSPNSRHVA
jgi:spore coat polysaccharide biosynthesis protein SpsF